MPVITARDAANQWEMNGSLSCATHRYVFDGTTSTQSLDMCLGSGATRAQFRGTVTKDGVPGSGSWTVTGSTGVYALNIKSDFGSFVGSLATYLPCPASWFDQVFAGAHYSSSSPAPQVFACHATGNEGPNVISYPGGDGQDYFTGPATGSGSCLSELGEWTVQYSGTWSEAGPFPPTQCPGVFLLNVTVTNRSSGVSLQQSQSWSDTGAAGVNLFEVDSSGVPIGAGVDLESPDPCTFSPYMTTNTTWVFAIFP